MPIVAAAGAATPGKGSVISPAGGDDVKTVTGPNTPKTQEVPSFVSIMVQGKSQKDEKAPAPKKKTTDLEDKGSDKDTGSACGQLVNCMVAQLLASAGSPAETKSAHVSASEGNHLSANELSGPLQIGQPAVETAALTGDEAAVLPACKVAVPANGTTILPAGKATGMPADEAAVLPSGKATVLPANEAAVLPVNKATVLPADGTTVTPAGETIALPLSEENPATALNLPQGRKNISAGQGKEENGSNKAVSVFQAGVTEKIVDTLKSMSRSETSGHNLGETGKSEKSLFTGEAEDSCSPVAVQTYNETEKKTEDLAPKNTAVEKALDNFVHDLSRVERGNSEIRIVLEPESLGVLTISVSYGENGISAKIKSNDRETCDIISGQIHNLIQSMENKGIKVEDVDVVFGQMKNEMSFAQSNQNGSGGEYTPHRYVPPMQRKAEALDCSEIYDVWQGYADVSNEPRRAVEYRI